MARTGYITINGTQYPMCFSTRVLVALEERGKAEGKTVDETLQELVGGKENGVSISASFWLLSTMIDAGIRHEKLNGACDLTAPTYDELLDLVSPDEYGTMFTSISDTISGGQERTVEAEAPKDRKNAAATRKEK